MIASFSASNQIGEAMKKQNEAKGIVNQKIKSKNKTNDTDFEI